MQALPLDRAAPPAAVATPGAARLDFIDAAKALGIVLVVVAHAPGATPSVLSLIYSFHMPLFFFISGFLQPAAGRQPPWILTLRRAAHSLLTPYLFFFVVSLLYWLATRHIGSRAAKFSGVGVDDALFGLFSGLSSDLFVNVTLWFFPCLFLCRVIHAGARRWWSAGTVFAGATLLGIALLAIDRSWSPRWPWGMDIVWIALVFYAAGHTLRVAGREHESRSDRANLAVAVVSATLWLGLVELQGRVDLAQANFGTHPLLYLPCALAGVVCVFALARLCPPNPVLRWLADNSLVIFPLHPLLINLASGALQLADLKALPERHELAWWALSAAWGIVACVPLARMLRRHVPGLLGRPPATPAAGRP